MTDGAELSRGWPALLDALGYVGTGVLVIADRGQGLERWYVNEPAAAILGYSTDELESLAPIDMIAPEQRPLVRQLSSSFRSGQPVPPTLEFTALHKNGS